MLFPLGHTHAMVKERAVPHLLKWLLLRWLYRPFLGLTVAFLDKLR